MKLRQLALAVMVSAAFNSAPAAIRYVDVNSATPTPPYTSWATAATNIQDAVDAAATGDHILVTNGVYQTGARRTFGEFRATGGYGLNRVVVQRYVTIQSVNGPEVTIIVGYQVPGTTNGPAAARCAYLSDGARLVGFTLTNGATEFGMDGGGVYCKSETASEVVSNCVMAGNSADYQGGGSFRGTLWNCTLKGNSVGWRQGQSNSGYGGGGACSSRLNNCVLMDNRADHGYGGGAAAEYGGSSILSNCTLTGNTAYQGYGGGAYRAQLYNCKVAGNSAGYGGGTYGGTLMNCTLNGNQADQDGGGAGGGILGINCTFVGNVAGYRGGGVAGYGSGTSTLRNCIVFYNSALFLDSTSNYQATVFDYSCTTPLPSLYSGVGNFTNAPLFADPANGNFRLQSNSPCINSGRNAFVIARRPDLDGNPRIASDTVDMGAYEFQSPSSVLSYAWAQQYGLPTDGSADYADTDTDLMNNWQEWNAGTVPTDAASVLRMLTPTPGASGTIVSWQSVSDRTYFLERATNLGAAPSFSLLTNNIVGQPGTTTYTDTNAAGPFFYRVGVQP